LGSIVFKWNGLFPLKIAPKHICIVSLSPEAREMEILFTRLHLKKDDLELIKLKQATLSFSACVGSSGGVCDQKTSKFFVSHRKESMAGHLGVNGKYKRERGWHRWNLEAKRECFPSPGTFKTYADLWEGAR
jgi:hypothetical protein